MTYLDVDEKGNIRLEELLKSIKKGIILISIMIGNIVTKKVHKSSVIIELLLETEHLSSIHFFARD